ncbi:tyrosine-type recombinase/integrase [Microbacterium maritypicum]|uniref:Integrase n=1 Tax=Microbacterium maritypicum TaxID=33918 RepID=A0A4Y4B7M2_MICMQ|nr:tyrosine-type recombinase/integrase [Microbacterium liquefaciens]GEC76571.1 integrase [Microbacterium liquefaciens]GGV62699.1 integrase [Microbacterium liquefaciens]
MSIERREGSAGIRWRVRLHSGGRVVADRTFTTKRAAEVWERQQKEALHGGGFVSPQQTRTPVSEVAAAFLLARSGQVAPHTLRTDRDNIAALPPKFIARPIGSVSEADVLALLTDLLGARAHSTVSRLRTTLSALWTWAVRERWTPTNPVRGVRMPSGSVQAHDGAPLTFPALAAIIDAQRERSPHGALITEWLSLTGLRWSELRALRVADLQDLPFPAVRVLRAQSDGYAEKAPKSARGRRTVPLVARAYEIAREWASGKGSIDYLATSATGLQLRGTYFRRAVAWTTTSSEHTIHDLRHYAASTWLRQGVPINQVAAWLGDDPRTVLKVYAHVLGEAQDNEALRRLNAPLPSRSPKNTPEHETREGGRPEELDKTGSDQGIYCGDGGI